MRLFRCATCRQLVFFENTTCIRCGSRLAFDPALCVMCTDPMGIGAQRRCIGGAPGCNWLAVDGPEGRDGKCLSCKLTVSPQPLVGTLASACWERLEAAKRRLVYGLLRLQLPMDGLRFSFPEQGLTGHADGLITVVLSEADEVERERRRIDLHEPSRTLIGHLRHESGHFFFGRLILNSPSLAPVRQAFGDERSDYATALQRYYTNGPPLGWDGSFISAYAAAHPFEDWAETWAHYLHIIDAVELSTAYGLSLSPTSIGPDGKATIEFDTAISATHTPNDIEFDGLIAAWLPLTYLANSLNRSTGHRDWYPFVINQPVIDKLRVIHHVVSAQRRLKPSPMIESAASAA